MNENDRRREAERGFSSAEFLSLLPGLDVWKLDRLARSMRQLIKTVETVRLRGIGFRT